MKRFLSILAIATTSVALFSTQIASASATTEPALPSNQHLFAFDCDRHLDQLVQVSSTDGAVTLVGTAPAPGEWCTLSAQFNPVDRKVYFIHDAPEHIGNSNAYNGRWLGTVNTATGVMTKIADFSGSITRPTHLMITNSGQAFVSTPGFLHSLNLRTAVVETIGRMYSEFNAMAYSPVTDKIYAYVDGSNDAFIVDRTTGVASGDSAHNVNVGPNYDCPQDGLTGGRALYSASFDANGNPWFLNGGCDSEIVVQDFATGTGAYRGQLHDPSHTLSSNIPHYDFEVSAMFITTDAQNGAASVPASLANTGTSLWQNASLVGIGGVALSAGAVALLLSQRRRSRY